MDLLLGLAVMAITFGIVATYGLVAVDGGRMTLRRDKGSPQTASRAAQVAAPAFTPLELGDVSIRWPSEVPHEAARLPALPWPSETWTDDFFGRRAPPSGAPIADGWDRPQAEAASPPPPKAKPKPKSELRAKESRPAKAAPPAPKQAPSNRPPPRQPAPSSPIPDEALIELVEQKGLAAAVEAIRGKTGWDFQKAAQHIAQVLRNRRGRS